MGENGPIIQLTCMNQLIEDCCGQSFELNILIFLCTNDLSPRSVTQEKLNIIAISKECFDILRLHLQFELLALLLSVLVIFSIG